MQVRLLVDGEEQMVLLHLLEDGEADVPARAADLATEVVLGDDFGGGDRVTGVDAIEGLDVLVAQVPLLEQRLFLGLGGARAHFLEVVPGRQEGGLRAVDTGLDVARARGGDDTGDQVALADQAAGDDPLRGGGAGGEVVLPDVAQPVVARLVGVVGDHRDALGQSVVDRLIEGRGVDQGGGDAVDAGGNGCVYGGDHVGGERGRGTCPRRCRYAEDGGRVLQPVDRGREERVGGHVVDERELVRRVAGEHRDRCCPGRTGRCGAPLGEHFGETRP